MKLQKNLERNGIPFVLNNRQVYCALNSSVLDNRPNRKTYKDGGDK